MKTQKDLVTFVFVKDGKVISPILTSTRQYGEWMKANFDEYTCQQELMLKTNEVGLGTTQWHPGTKIGNFFDSNTFSDSENYSWYIHKDCNAVKKLCKKGIVELKDAINKTSKDTKHVDMIRCYTIRQIEVYLKTKIDSRFTIADKYMLPQQIKINDLDLAGIDKKVVNKGSHKKKLF